MRDTDDEHPTDAHDALAAHGLDDDGETLQTASYDDLEPGSDVGGYLIDGVLGQGGMGTVYSATHPVIGKRAAIKVLRPELSNNPAAVERFMIEARAVNQIGHHNIVDIFAFGKLADGRSYYVMDLLTGESLRRRIKRTGPLHVSEAVVAIDEIASALLAAHGKGIIHRDLKPDNVFMVQTPERWPEVKILDWGLLKLTSQQNAISNAKYRTLAGSVMGTPVYMSPEQARASDQIDSRSDIYSLGVVAYELFTGNVPFRRGSSIDTLLAHQDEPVPSLALQCPELPDELVQLIEAMLAKEPGDRPTLTAVRTVLKRLRATKIPSMPDIQAPQASPFDPPGPEPYSEPPSHDEATQPRLRQTPVPSSGGALPLPPPPPNVPGQSSPSMPGQSSPMPGQSSPSMPYQSMTISQQTLAGHSMPNAVVSRTPVNNPPAVYPYGSVPPQSTRSSRDPLVFILIAAIILAAIGIVVVVTVL